MSIQSLQDLGIQYCPMCDTYVHTETCLDCEAEACENCGMDASEVQHATTWVPGPCEEV